MYTGIGEDFYNALVKTKHAGLLFCESLPCTCGCLLYLTVPSVHQLTLIHLQCLICNSIFEETI